MSLCGKKWIIKEIIHDDFWKNVFGESVCSRNIKDYWPYTLPNLQNGIEMILNAINEKHKIGIVGDFDVDGSCGTALMIKFLKFFNINFVYYTPNRFTDGYGISSRICQHLYDQQVQLVITIDNGTTAYEAIKTIKELNMNVIILDHHAIGNDLSINTLINPHLKTDGFKDICATTVVFLFLCELNKHLENKFPIRNEVDLVSIATVCDVMPIMNINKSLVFLGLQLMNTNIKPAFKLLLCNNNPIIDTDTIGFYIGPYLNAPGRMGDSNCTVNVLTCEDDSLMQQVMQMIKYNFERKEIESNILKTLNINDKKQTICLSGEWYEGVIGIIAGKLKERYNKNVCVINSINGKASMRSIGNIHAGHFIKDCVDKQIIEFGGGHWAAGGFTIKVDKISSFEEHFENYVAHHLGDYIPELKINSVLSLSAINKEFIQEMRSFGPFGSIKPLFLFPNCVITNAYLDKNTLHLHISNMDSTFRCTIFHIHHSPLIALRNATYVNIVGYPYERDKSINLYIVDAEVLNH